MYCFELTKIWFLGYKYTAIYDISFRLKGCVAWFVVLKHIVHIVHIVFLIKNYVFYMNYVFVKKCFEVRFPPMNCTIVRRYGHRQSERAPI